ncbi:MAG: hypothetical protein Q7R43_01210 [Candidatus Daviesbacteria bacterium]|nr:hypothetical protein [Candidatus Daviesbacteria bacterium]
MKKFFSKILIIFISLNLVLTSFYPVIIYAQSEYDYWAADADLSAQTAETQPADIPAEQPEQSESVTPAPEPSEFACTGTPRDYNQCVGCLRSKPVHQDSCGNYSTGGEQDDGACTSGCAAEAGGPPVVDQSSQEQAVNNYENKVYDAMYGKGAVEAEQRQQSSGGNYELAYYAAQVGDAVPNTVASVVENTAEAISEAGTSVGDASLGAKPQLINNCLKEECDPNLGEMVCIQYWSLPDEGVVYTKVGSSTGKKCPSKTDQTVLESFGLACQTKRINDCADTKCDLNIGENVCIEKWETTCDGSAPRSFEKPGRATGERCVSGSSCMPKRLQECSYTKCDPNLGYEVCMEVWGDTCGKVNNEDKQGAVTDKQCEYKPTPKEIDKTDEQKVAEAMNLTGATLINGTTTAPFSYSLTGSDTANVNTGAYSIGEIGVTRPLDIQKVKSCREAFPSYTEEQIQKCEEENIEANKTVALITAGILATSIAVPVMIVTAPMIIPVVASGATTVIGTMGTAGTTAYLYVTNTGQVLISKAPPIVKQGLKGVAVVVENGDYVMDAAKYAECVASGNFGGCIAGYVSATSMRGGMPVPIGVAAKVKGGGAKAGSVVAKVEPESGGATNWIKSKLDDIFGGAGKEAKNATQVVNDLEKGADASKTTTGIAGNNVAEDLSKAIETKQPIVIKTAGSASTGVDDLVAQLDSVESKINKGIIDDEVIAYWQSLVRDTDGRYAKYAENPDTKGYFSGTQPKPDLTDTKQLKYIQSSIDQDKAFLQGLNDGSYQGDFKTWLQELHIKQSYKGTGGDLIEGRPIAGGAHTPVVEDEVIPIAKKYGDPYTVDPKKRNIVQLSGIDQKGLPYDQWTQNNEFVIHYYPDSKYYDMYLTQMEKSLDKYNQAISSGNSQASLNAIAEYYQYGVNARMFEQTNQALFANQANAMLTQIGLKAPEQGILDFVAMRLQPKNFAKYFTDEVGRVNPGVLGASSDMLVGVVKGVSVGPVNQVSVMSTDQFELDAKKALIKKQLVKDGKIDLEYAKEVVNTEILKPKVKTGLNDYVLTTGKTGTVEGIVEANRYKVIIDPLPGVDLIVPDTIKVGKDSSVIIPVKVKKGSGKVEKLSMVFAGKGWHLINPVYAEEKNEENNQSTVQVTITNEQNEPLPWAGVSVKLEKIDQEKNISLNAGWNLVTLPALPNQALSASVLLDQINTQGGEAVAVSSLEDGAWKSYVKRGDKDYSDSADNFVIEPGKAYFIKALKPAKFNFVGQNFAEPVKLNLSSGWNAVGFPKTSKDYKAGDLPGVGTVAFWDFGIWNTFVKNENKDYGDNFRILNNAGYVLKIDKGEEFSP